MRKGFTLIEILVVITIIGILSTVTAITFSSSLRSSRDARRKADINQIKAALELYRSNNAVYPGVGAGTGQIQTMCGTATSLTDPAGGTGTYLTNIPQDPLCPTYTYAITTNASDYTVGTYLEGTATTCSVLLSCGSGVSCNYCLGPYGQK